MLAAGLLAAACATPQTVARWEKPGADERDFNSANATCGAESTRLAGSSLPQIGAPAATAPRNTLSTPPRIDANPARHDVYLSCMRDHGWNVVGG